MNDPMQFDGRLPFSAIAQHDEAERNAFVAGLSRLRSQSNEILISTTGGLPMRPEQIGGRRKIPVLMQLREPDETVSATIAAADIAALRLFVDHTQRFNPGDRVLVVQATDEVLLAATVLRIQGDSIYLTDIDAAYLMGIRIGDRLMLQQQDPSSALTYPEVEIQRHSKKTAENIRRYKATEPLTKINEKVVRTPGQQPRMFAVYYVPLIESRKPPGEALIDGDIPVTPPESKPGWLLYRIVDEDYAFNGRWLHWQQTDAAGQMIEPIPFLEFGNPHEKTMEMLRHCLTLINPEVWSNSVADRFLTIDLFLDWMLWSVGHPAVPNFPEAMLMSRAHDYLIQVFDASLLILFPADYFGALIDEVTGTDDWTPHNIAENAIKNIFPGRRNDYRNELLIDPECGSGAYGLAASNRTYRYQGISSDPMSAKAALLNHYFYAPWYVLPFEWLSTGETVDDVGRTLSLLNHKKLPSNYFGSVELCPTQIFLPIALVRERPPKPLRSQPIEQIPLPPISGLALPGGMSINPSLNSGVMPTQRMTGTNDTLMLPNAAQSPLPLPQSSPQLPLPNPQPNALPPADESAE